MGYIGFFALFFREVEPEKWNLEYALNVLGLSGQARYLPILNEYAHYVDPEIRESARDAIREIEYRVAHAAPAQKAG